jgi:hypothetical protein
MRLTSMVRISGLLLILLLLLGGCSPPLELLRPAVAPPDAAARTLLPPGRVEAIRFPRAVDGAQVAAEGGGRMIALRFANATHAESAFEALVKREEPSDVSRHFSVSVGSLHYVRYSKRATYGFVWVSDRWVFLAEAATADRLAALIAASGAGGVEDYAWLKPYLWLIAGILVLVLARVALLLLRMSRSYAIPPAVGAAPVSREALVARLLALNDPSRPWLVRTGPEADVVVEWKYADAVWWGIMSKQGLRELHRLRLYLNEAPRRVGGLDETSTIEWSGGREQTPSYHVGRSRFRGIQLFKSKRDVAYGFDTPTGGGFGKQLDVNFDLNALKQPVVAAVTAAGWSYAPVMRPQ